MDNIEMNFNTEPAEPLDAASVPASQTSGVVVGEPDASCIDASAIQVYVEKICQNNCDASDSISTFDIVFNVCIYDKEKCMTTSYNVVRRVGVDKMSLASSALCTVPTSVLEQKSNAVDDMKAAAIQKLKVLAGI